MTTLNPLPELRLPQMIDSTMLNTFRSCPRKFYWEYIRCLRQPETAHDLHAGGVFASGLEMFYKAIGAGKTVEESKLLAFKTFTREWGDVPDPAGHVKSQDNMWIALDDYIKTYPPAIDRFQPLKNPDGSPTVEFTFAIPLEFDGFPRHPSGEPFIYSGRADGLGTYDGLLCVKDEKTTKSLGSKWPEQWSMRGQFIGYTWAAQMSGFEALDRVLVRGICILKTEIKQAEVLKIYTQVLRDKWFYQLREDLRRLVQCWDEGYFDMNFGDACMAYFRPCQFMILCESPEPENWVDTYVEKHWNPTSKNPLAEESELKGDQV